MSTSLLLMKLIGFIRFLFEVYYRLVFISLHDVSGIYNILFLWLVISTVNKFNEKSPREDLKSCLFNEHLG